MHTSLCGMLTLLFSHTVKCLPAGLEPNPDNSACVVCNVGFYKPENELICTACPENRTTADIGSTAEADCSIGMTQTGYWLSHVII